jgi:prepilin-type N-terminal cleavage/methylation domain-containing protein
MSRVRDFQSKSGQLSRQDYGFSKGYSLIELLTVIAIIGILATIAIPTYHGYRDKARMGTIYAALRQVKLAQEVYFTDHGGYFGIEDPIDGPASKEVEGLDVKIYIPNQQIWDIKSIQNTAEDSSTEVISNQYTVLIDTNMDRNQDGNRDQYFYFKKADAGGSTIEESDSFPLIPVALN